jgi:glutamine amidotransferase
MNVAVIDYGVGNLKSIARTLEELKMRPSLISRPIDLRLCDCLLLPGVGSFFDCMKLLDENGKIVSQFLVYV